MEFRDYYKTLGVERTASDSEIKSSFRKLARKFHPDVNPNNKDAEKRFKEINEAYQVLSDPEKRKKYNLLGADWERGAAEEEVRRRYGAQGGDSSIRPETSATFSRASLAGACAGVQAEAVIRSLTAVSTSALRGLRARPISKPKFQ